MSRSVRPVSRFQPTWSSRPASADPQRVSSSISAAANGVLASTLATPIRWPLATSGTAISATIASLMPM